MAKKTRRKKYKPWLATELRALKQYSRQKLPVVKIEKLMKRTVGTLSQKAFTLGLPLGTSIITRRHPRGSCGFARRINAFPFPG
jgi:hypothetical protein